MAVRMEYLNNCITKNGILLYNQDYVFKVLRKVHVPIGDPLVQIEGTYKSQEDADAAVKLCIEEQDKESTLKLHYEVCKVGRFVKDSDILPKRVQQKAFDPDVDHYVDDYDPMENMRTKEWEIF